MNEAPRTGFGLGRPLSFETGNKEVKCRSEMYV